MTKAIPDGYHSLTPFLAVAGASQAIDFYKQAFGAEERMRMPGPDGRIMHAELQIGDSVVMLSDAMPEFGNKDPKALGGSPVGIYLYVEDVDAVFKQALEAGATEKHAVNDMFWGDRMGSLEDPFGHQWTVATHQKDLTPEEIQAGQAEWLASMKPPE